MAFYFNRYLKLSLPIVFFVLFDFFLWWYKLSANADMLLFINTLKFSDSANCKRNLQSL